MVNRGRSLVFYSLLNYTNEYYKTNWRNKILLLSRIILVDASFMWNPTNRFDQQWKWDSKKKKNESGILVLVSMITIEGKCWNLKSCVSKIWIEVTYICSLFYVWIYICLWVLVLQQFFGLVARFIIKYRRSTDSPLPSSHPRPPPPKVKEKMFL